MENYKYFLNENKTYNDNLDLHNKIQEVLNDFFKQKNTSSSVFDKKIELERGYDFDKTSGYTIKYYDDKVLDILEKKLKKIILEPFKLNKTKDKWTIKKGREVIINIIPKQILDKDIYKSIVFDFLVKKGYKHTPKHTDGKEDFTVASNGYKFQPYSEDRMQLKDDLEKYIKNEKIKFSIEEKFTYIENNKGDILVTIRYKNHISSSGSGAGSKNTTLQELSQAIVTTLSFDIKKRKLNEYDLTKENLTIAYEKVTSDNMVSIEDINDFMYNDKWKYTFLKSNDLLFDKYHSRNKQYSSHRDSPLVKKIYNIYKSYKTGAKDDKWNPADIWLVSNKFNDNELNQYKYVEDGQYTLNDYNSYLRTQFENGDLIGISLKKVGTNPKLVEKNTKDTKFKDYKYKDYTLSNESKDVYVNATNGDRVQFRSFGTLSGYQGELKGQFSSHGKIGYGIFTMYLKNIKGGNLNLPIQQVKVKQDMKSDGNFYIKFKELWNKYFNKELHLNSKNNEDIKEEIHGRLPDTYKYQGRIYETNKPNWVYTKYLSMLLLEDLNSLSKNQKDSFTTSILNYANSESDFSSTYVKIY